MPTTVPMYIELSGSHLIDDDTPIYRYLPLGQFMHIVEKKTISLLQAINAWDDPHEGALFNTMLQEVVNEKARRDRSFEPYVVDKSDRFTKHLHGTSWSLLEESDAMWRIYSPSKQGVKIKTTVGELKATLQSVQAPDWWDQIFYTVGKVLYDPPDLDENIFSEFAYMFLHKRLPFKHEDEIRGIVHPIQYSKNPPSGQYNGPLYAYIPDNFIEEVIVDPRATTWFLDTVESYCIKNGINKCRISDLYQNPE